MIKLTKEDQLQKLIDSRVCIGYKIPQYNTGLQKLVKMFHCNTEEEFFQLLDGLISFRNRLEKSLQLEGYYDDE